MLMMGLATTSDYAVFAETRAEVGAAYTATVSRTMIMLGKLAGFVAPVVGIVILQRVGTGDGRMESADRYDRGGAVFRQRADCTSIRNRRGEGKD